MKELCVYLRKFIVRVERKKRPFGSVLKTLHQKATLAKVGQTFNALKTSQFSITYGWDILIHSGQQFKAKIKFIAECDKNLNV